MKESKKIISVRSIYNLMEEEGNLNASYIQDSKYVAKSSKEIAEQ